jgi:transcriptional regulator with XRE-family HTH domain
LSTKSPNPIDIFVGSRVRMRRLMLGMSQENLAEGLGITFQQVQKYEKGTNRIGASRLQLISRLLGVSPGFFFEQDRNQATTLDGIGSVDDEISSFILSKEGVVLNRAFQKISDADVRKNIISLVASMAQGNEEPES